MNPTETRAASMLGDLAAQQARTQASGDAIKSGAAERLEAVNKQLDELRPQVLQSADAAEQYQALIVERYRLSQVVMAT